MRNTIKPIVLVLSSIALISALLYAVDPIQQLKNAILTDNTPKIKALLKSMPRPTINTRDATGWTPLMVAAYFGKKDAVEELLNTGADATFKDAEGKTALDLAKEHAAPENITKYKKIERALTLAQKKQAGMESSLTRELTHLTQQPEIAKQILAYTKQ